MATKPFTHELFTRAMKLAKHPYRPRQILELEEKIRAATQLTCLKAGDNGIDPEDIIKVAQMKIELDNLYAAWLEGKIE